MADRITTKTNYKIKRHGELVPVYRIRLNESEKDLVGKTYTLKKGFPIYEINGKELTENKKGISKDGQKFTITDILTVKSEILNPSTWKQGSNLFAVFNNVYVHYEALENVTDLLHIGIRTVKEKSKEYGEIFLKLLVFAILLNIFLNSNKK